MVDDIMKAQGNQTDGCRNLAGPKIKEIRDKTNMTQRELVSKLEERGVYITPCTLSKIETQKRSITDIELSAFSRALEVGIDELIDVN